MALSGRIISKIRESKMLTQESLADQIGVSRQTIAMWETGKRLPTDSVIILTARTLELDEGDLMYLTQQERLKLRIERLEDQYGVTIIIANKQEGESKMGKGKNTAYQTKDGVSFAITNICKSLNYEYPEELMKEEEVFHKTSETSNIKEHLIITMVAQSDNEEFILNGRYFSSFEIIDNLGNHFLPIAEGSGTSVPSEHAVGGTLEGYAHYKYAPESHSINLRHRFASIREEDCDFIMFENVRLDDSGITKSLGDIAITYEGVIKFKYGNPPSKSQDAQQIHIQLHEHGNPSYVGIREFTDNLGNVYKPHGWSWTLEEKTREGFLVDNIDPKAESISFRYWISRKILEFEFFDLMIPS